MCAPTAFCCYYYFLTNFCNVLAEEGHILSKLIRNYHAGLHKNVLIFLGLLTPIYTKNMKSCFGSHKAAKLLPKHQPAKWQVTGSFEPWFILTIPLNS